MSDLSQAALTPLHHVVKTGKKRKRNFRPTSSKNASAKSQPASNSVVSSNTTERAHEEEEGALDDEVPFESEFSDELHQQEEVTSEPPPKAPSVASSVVRPRARPKKSKKIAVSVGPSRPPAADITADTFTDKQVNEGSQLRASAVSTSVARLPVEDTSAMDEMDAAILARDQGGLPKLNSFCTSFKVKRKQKGAAGEGRETVAPNREHRNHDARDVSNTITSGPVVQIVNGEIVLQESSVVINRASTKLGDEDASVVEEEAQLAVVGATANSFTNRNKSQRWTADQTRLFYHALRQVGTDFGTMEAFFNEKRTRKQLKRKYQAEMTRNPLLVEKALDPSTRSDLDLSVFQLSEEEKKKINEPRTSPTTADDSLEREENRSDSVLSNRRVLSNAGRDSEEEEAVEEDALEERNRHLASEEVEPQTKEVSQTTEPFLDPTFHHPEDTLDDPLFGEDENDDTAVVSLIPAVATTVKNKKKPNFRSLRTKRKK